MAGPWLTSPESSDEALVVRVVAGNLAAYSLLYDRYNRPVYAIAVHPVGSAEANVVVHEFFLRFWRSAAQFDETRGRFAPWLVAVLSSSATWRRRPQSATSASAASFVIATKRNLQPSSRFATASMPPTIEKGMPVTRARKMASGSS